MDKRREDLLKALERWRSERPWARRDPKALPITDVVAAGPVQVVLLSTYESRGVQLSYRPTHLRPEVPEPAPDPWALSLEQPERAPIGHEVKVALQGQLHQNCEVCFASGRETCPACQKRHDPSNRDLNAGCGTCRGTLRVLCRTCSGSGGVLARAVAWSKIEQTESVRVKDTSDLPVDVFLELQSTDHGGVVIHEQEAAQIIDIRRASSGYRDGGAEDPLRATVQTLTRDSGVPTGARLIRQRLEIREVPVFHVTLENESTAWVYGDPPKVSPANAFRTLAGHAARVIPGLKN